MSLFSLESGVCFQVYTIYALAFMRLKVGSSLGAVELLRISSVLDATLRIKAGYGGCSVKMKMIL